jgi:imidazolonepropionase-like amidohydrolase
MSNCRTVRSLLTADRIWDGRAAAPIDHGFVLVEDGHVAAIGRQADLGTLDGAEPLALGDATIMPGLINGHVHLTFSGTTTVVEDYTREAADGLAALTLRAVHNLHAAARVGVTTVRDLGTVNEVAFAVRAAAADGRIPAPRVLSSGRPLTVTGGHCHWFSHCCDNADQIRTAVRRQVHEGADVIKIFASGGNMTPRTNPHEPQYTEEELRACVQEARRLQVPVAAHAHAPEPIRRAVEAGATTIEHCLFETPDGVDYDPAIAESMARQGIAFCPTLGVSFRRLAALAPKAPVLARILAREPLFHAALRNLLAAGAPLLAGNDAGIIGRPFDDYPADLAVLVGEDGLGLSPRQVLTAATSGAAALLGLTDTGVLAPGRRADLLAVAGDPLTDITDLTRTRHVLIAGRNVPATAARQQPPSSATAAAAASTAVTATTNGAMP